LTQDTISKKISSALQRLKNKGMITPYPFKPTKQEDVCQKKEKNSKQSYQSWKTPGLKWLRKVSDGL
jgi:hypothetical protein